MIGTALSAFTKIASSVYGGIMAKRAAEEGQQKLDKMKRENDAEDRRVSYRDPSQSIVAQYALRRTFDAIRDRNRQAAGTAAVMGATPESVAVEKSANAEQGAETAARVAASEAARQDQLHQQHLTRKQQLEQEEYNLTQQKRQNIANAVQNGLNVAGGIAQG